MKRKVTFFCLMVFSITLWVPSKAQSINTEAQQTQDRAYLQDLISKALHQNREVQNLQLGYHKTEIQKKMAWGTFIPKVSLNGGYAYAGLNVHDIQTPQSILGMGQNLGGMLGGLAPVIAAGNPALGAMLPELIGKLPEIPSSFGLTSNDMNIWNAGISAKMVLFSGLKVTYLSKALDHKIAAERLMVKRQEGQVIKEVTDYYDKLGLISASEQVLNDARKLLDKEKTRAQKAKANGLITRYDLQKIEIASLDLDTKDIELSGNKQLVLTRLEQLTGEPAEAIAMHHVVLTPWVQVSTGNDINHRPEVAALKESVAARSYQQKATISGYLPKAMAFGTSQYINMKDMAVVDPASMVGVAVTWEIFDGFHTAHERQIAKIDHTIAVNKLEDATSLLALSLEKTKVDFQVNSSKIAVLQQKVEKANLGLEIRSKEYAEGLATVNQLLEAITDLQQTKMALNKVIYDQRRAGVSLLEATGDLQLENIQ